MLNHLCLHLRRNYSEDDPIHEIHYSYLQNKIRM